MAIENFGNVAADANSGENVFAIISVYEFVLHVRLKLINELQQTLRKISLDELDLDETESDLAVKLIFA